jgi:hypothetical protein
MPFIDKRQIRPVSATNAASPCLCLSAGTRQYVRGSQVPGRLPSGEPAIAAIPVK